MVSVPSPPMEVMVLCVATMATYALVEVLDAARHVHRELDALLQRRHYKNHSTRRMNEISETAVG